MANKVPDDVYFASISELTARLRAKEFSAVELTRAFCDRLEKIGPQYNALALSLRKDALRKAKDADDEIKRERYRPLQGIPYGAKDLLAVANRPTTWGAKPYADQVFEESAAVIQKLEKGGAILIGKLAMVELAGGGGYRYPSASLTGPGLNPWDRTRWSGGSSSGSGIATAAGLVTFSLGSETSGSILTPSAFCGVTGLRPTYGLVSRRGAMALSWTLDKIGPLCRSAEDCGLVLHVIAGGDSSDPGSAGKSFSYFPQFARKPQELTVGYAPVDFEEYAIESARPDFKSALDAVKSTGVKMKQIELPDFPYGAILSTILNGEMGSIFEPLIKSGKVDQLADKRQIAGLKASLDLPASEYLKAMRIRSLVQQKFRELFVDIDILLTPSRSGPASKVTEALDRATAGPRPQSRGLSGMIPAGNLCGLPAISLPCGFADQMPIAISLVGRPFTENQLLALGKLYQSQTDWHRRHPPVTEPRA
ncbi:MAG TPA: amidase [Bryobacteraceae bacterium]|nr:amidase [Bryobacteraceae bacterium]